MQCYLYSIGYTCLETTASTLQFFWFLICMDPGVQNEIIEEKQQKDKFNYEDIRDFKVDFLLFSIPVLSCNIKYWDACMKGKMRMFPAASDLSRYCRGSTSCTLQPLYSMIGEGMIRWLVLHNIL